MTVEWSSQVAARMGGMTSSVIRELLKLTQRPSVISFAGGLPAAEYFPTARVQAACETVLAQQAHYALQYGPTEGYLPLREMIADWMCGDGLCVTADNILITSGSQQALSMIGALFIDPGNRVLVERPTYLGAIQAFALYQSAYVGAPTDSHGICVDEIPAALAHDPKFMYILPNFQNPAGVTLSQERREVLVRLAQGHGIPIVEDDPYGALRFEGKMLPPIIALDAAATGHNGDMYAGNVIYLSTFSKTLTPGLRVAWIAAPKAILARLIQIKQSIDLHTSTFNQMVTYEVARDGFLEEHVARLCVVYRRRRDAMLEALGRWAPPDITWTQPEGGLFLWLHLPPDTSDQAIFEAAIQQDVAFVPGGAFFTDGGPPTARLNFSCMPEDRIQEGIKRLCRVIRDHHPVVSSS